MADREFIAYIFSQCKAEEIENVRVHFENRKKTYLNIENGEIEEFSQEDEEGINLSGSFQGYFCSTYIEKPDKEAAAAAISAMKETAEENGKKQENLPLAENRSNGQPFTAIDWNAAAKELKKQQEEIKQQDERICSVNQTSLCQIWVQTSLFDENGTEMTESFGYFKGAVELVVSEKEKKQNAFRSMTAQNPEAMDYLMLGRKALSEAAGLLAAEPVPSGEYAVVFENRTAADLFSYFLPVFEQAEAEKGDSGYADKLGEMAASPIFTMYEEPCAGEVPQQRQFDDEGTQTCKKYFFDKGKVGTFMNTSKEAAKEARSGNAFRGHYRNSIKAKPVGVFIEAGSKSTDEILREQKKVIYITGLDGLFAGVNAKTGDFSVIATGFLMEQGKVIQPVNQITVGGNFYQMVKDIKEVSSDRSAADYWDTYVYAPAVLVNSLKIGGL